MLAAAAPAGEPVRVKAVLDGDTVILEDNRRVRLIGINTPERARRERPGQPLAEAARQALQRLSRRPLRLVPGTRPYDRYGRTLAYLVLDRGVTAQERLLEAGLGAAVAIPPNIERLDRLRAAEARARRAGRGIWGHSYFRPIDAARMTAEHTGFRFVRGTIRRYWYRKKTIYFALTEELALTVPRRDWPRFGREPVSLLGKTVTARGWVSRYRDGRLRLRTPHPFMMGLLPAAPGETISNH